MASASHVHDSAIQDAQAHNAQAHDAQAHDSTTHGASLHSPHANESSPLVRFDDFCFAYDEHIALSHINLEIVAGDCAVLMGDNGCGKSTLLRAINGLIFAQQGHYYFDGNEVSERSMKDVLFAKKLHARIGFIFQDSDAQLFCANVEDEIAFGPRAMGLAEEEVTDRVDDVCKLLGIEHLRTRAPYHLSGGEQKKVAIACILSMNPDVYCFDEPLNGLDAGTRRWVVDFFGELKSAGKTLVIATHDQSLADEVADYFVYMGPEHEYTDKPHVHINYEPPSKKRL